MYTYICIPLHIYRVTPFQCHPPTPSHPAEASSRRSAGRLSTAENTEGGIGSARSGGAENTGGGQTGAADDTGGGQNGVENDTVGGKQRRAGGVRGPREFPMATVDELMSKYTIYCLDTEATPLITEEVRCIWIHIDMHMYGHGRRAGV